MPHILAATLFLSDFDTQLRLWILIFWFGAQGQLLQGSEIGVNKENCWEFFGLLCISVLAVILTSQEI